MIPAYRQSSPSGKLPLLSARSAVTFPAKKHHRPSTSTKLHCLVTKEHNCEQLAQGCYAALSWWGLNPPPIDRKFNALPPHPGSNLQIDIASVIPNHYSMNKKVSIF